MGIFFLLFLMVSFAFGCKYLLTPFLHFFWLRIVLSCLPHLFLVVLVVLLLSFSVLSLGWPEDEQGGWG